MSPNTAEMLTRNTARLRNEVAKHVAADAIVQGSYWDNKTNKGCFIGCLARGSSAATNEQEYGLPVMLQRIAESIFEALPLHEAKTFFASFPEAVGCDGKDLQRVGWQFLEAELRSLPQQKSATQSVIDPVIAGIGQLAQGQPWSADDACAAADAATDLVAAANEEEYAAARAAEESAGAAHAAAMSAGLAGSAVVWAARARAAARVKSAAAAWAKEEAAARAAGRAVTYAAWAKAGMRRKGRQAATRLRQRDLLLRLIRKAPTVA